MLRSFLYVRNSKGKCNRTFNQCRVYIHAYIELDNDATQATCTSDRNQYLAQDAARLLITNDIETNQPIMKTTGNSNRRKRSVSLAAENFESLTGIDSLVSLGPFNILPLTEDEIAGKTQAFPASSKIAVQNQENILVNQTETMEIKTSSIMVIGFMIFLILVIVMIQ